MTLVDKATDGGRARMHPLEYCQINELTPVEAEIVICVAEGDLGNRAAFSRAFQWLRRLRDEHYGKPMGRGNWPYAQARKPAEELLQAVQSFCAGNWLGEDACSIVTAVTLHRAEGSDGAGLLTDAFAVLERMLDPKPATGLPMETTNESTPEHETDD